MIIEKKIKNNYDLTALTTFKIGGRAEFFISVIDREELVEAINWARDKKLSWLILAGGSNILITKKKINGLVIRISGEEYFIKQRIVSAWAGCSLSKLAGLTFNRSLSGLEWALGVPGSLGGATRGNAGAYGSNISKQIIEVEAYDAVKRKLVKYSHRSCGFSYRHSIFKLNKNLIITNIKLKLNRGRMVEIKNLANRNLRQRRLVNPSEPSAGCVFKNLENKKLIKENRELAKILELNGLFRGGKMSVGYLITELGLKGKARHGAKVSEKHANFIVNTGKAEAKDVVGLINWIKNKFINQYKINLEEEIEYFGS